MAPLHFPGQDNQNKLQYDCFIHPMSLAPMSPATNVTLFFISLYTLLSFKKNILQSYSYVGLFGHSPPQHQVNSHSAGNRLLFSCQKFTEC